ncbi:anthranilate phosphoribosyltransferase [Metabacillus sp. GX 13764]|uniref:anthranilate phosphoribosyltransferase n=1 Tax=Metabacillus kandeliae TaxID=2900151 RepID=UPI001E4BB24D|nr:anthranilate phosphoribosyltransferase [Metabacillus kandeliae]MCD7033369.1 anthranilate phosphoribosyltransferase [Metabacillus kandeliae]
MKSILKQAIEGHTFSEDEACQIMLGLMNGEATPSQIASLLSIMRLRGETAEEIIGFTRAMRSKMISFHYREDVIDTCGTGGDGASTFNISTASAIVMASLGAKVAKHGNRAFSSKSGSADVLDRLGVTPQSSPEEAVNALEEKNMAFLFAPLYHASMKHAVEPRKDIGFRTVFNLLGPLANPAGAKKQMVGVFSPHYAKLMAEAMLKLGTKRALLASGRDGLDECSISAPTDVFEIKNGEILCYEVTPEEMGLKRGSLKEIKVSNPAESAALIHRAFSGDERGSASAIIALNAGAGLYTAGLAGSIREGVHEALQALKNGTALRHLEKMSGNKEEKYA